MQYEFKRRKAQNQKEYQRKYTGYCERFEAACNRLADGFDEKLWYSTVDSVTVYDEGCGLEAQKKSSVSTRSSRAIR
ncbi:hypothetical protein CE91St62_32660 [Lachnospiraceae bacterium]|nr:hypothetical protein CE91St61_32790 [Lachnospiraceae bacterium]BDF39205.1 hypothetical protein CE91St62_32660 [Lachnospiraceae bacterium]